MTNTSLYIIQHPQADDSGISFELDGVHISVPWAEAGSERLRSANALARSLFEIDVDGIGWHWPAVDEDLSTSGLLRAAGRDDLIRQPYSVYPSEPLPEPLAL
jgi:hypothetical protein